MDIVHVPLEGREYEVRIGSGLLGRAGAEIAPFLKRPKVAVITESRVAGLHLEALRSGLAADGIAMSALELEPGEVTKNWAGLQQAVGWLLDEK
ncbi:MAG TPA: 3-dehydroquinate synthase, partial [Aliiroseovarius sp.]|nr:3-dehydroquinate synthase [Aliiroseovarius sp.]